MQREVPDGLSEQPRWPACPSTWWLALSVRLRTALLGMPPAETTSKMLAKVAEWRHAWNHTYAVEDCGCDVKQEADEDDEDLGSAAVNLPVTSTVAWNAYAKVKGWADKQEEAMRAIPKTRGSSNMRKAAGRQVWRDFLEDTDALAMPEQPFGKLCGDVLKDVLDPRTQNTDMRLSKDAVRIVQVAAEATLAQLFNEASILTLHAKRKTTMERDLALVVKLRQSFGDDSLYRPQAKEARQALWGCFVVTLLDRLSITS